MKFLLWFGMSQTGKSSAISLLTGDKSIECGKYGKGESITKDVKVYEDIAPKLAQRYYFIDTIGLGDNRLIYNDSEIRNHIEKEIIRLAQQNNVNQIDAIVVTESLKNEIMSLPLVFHQIKNILGHLPTESIVVLGTKKNDCNPFFAEERVVKIHQKMVQQKIPANRYVQFYTPCQAIQFFENAIDQSQYTAFQNTLNTCPPIQIKSIEQKKQKILDRAVQIQKDKTKIHRFDYQVQVTRLRRVRRGIPVDIQNQIPMAGILGVIGYTRTMQQTRIVYTYVDVPYTVQETRQGQTLIVPQFDQCYRQALQEFEKMFTLPLSKKKIE